jgi:hypothetical protein
METAVKMAASSAGSVVGFNVPMESIIMTRFLKRVSFISAVTLCFGVATAQADSNGLKSSLTACRTPNSVEQNRIGGVLNCGKIWKIGRGSVKLSADGALKVNIRGLVLDDASTGDSNGTPDGVTGVVAALVCGPNGGTVVAQTAGVPISPAGRAAIRIHITLPGQCVAPIIVVREIFEGKIGGWLAATGF